MKLHNTDISCDHTKDIPPPQAQDSLSMPTFDADEYWDYVKDYDMSDAKKHELLETIWSIVTSFVDLAFGVHPLQHACGQLDKPFVQAAQSTENQLYLPHSNSIKTKTEEGETP